MGKRENVPIKPGSTRRTVNPSQRADERATATVGRHSMILPGARGRSRIAVLPFAASGSERGENLAFALAQETTAALGRCSRFDVIEGMSPNSTAPTCAVHEYQFRRMDLDYLVDLTVWEKGPGLEIEVRLLDLCGNARPIWSKRFDPANYAIHQIGELAAADIAGHIDPTFPLIGGDLKLRNHHGATSFLRRAVPLMYSMEREKFRQAGQLIKFAMEIDPEDAEIASWAARWQHYNIRLGYTAHSRQEFAKVRDFALRAIKLNPDHAEALAMYAHYCAFLEKNFDTALHYFDRSLRVNSNLAFVWELSSPTYCYIGDPRTALERLDHHRELTPFDPFIYFSEYHYAIAYLFNRDYERAAIVGRRAVEAVPQFVNVYKPLIAALGHLGRREEAKPYLDKLLALEPGFTVERFAEDYPIKKAADRRRYMEGLRLAGVAAR